MKALMCIPNEAIQGVRTDEQAVDFDYEDASEVKFCKGGKVCQAQAGPMS